MQLVHARAHICTAHVVHRVLEPAGVAGCVERPPPRTWEIGEFTGSNPDLTFPNHGQVKSMTLKLILVTS